MAIERIMLGAHECDGMLLCTADYAVDTLQEGWLESHLLIIRDAVTVEFVNVRATAQLLTKEHILDPLHLQCGAKFIPAEMWGPTRERRASHVGNSRHPSFRKHGQKRLEGQRRMPDGQHFVPVLRGPSSCLSFGLDFIIRVVE